MVKCDVVSPMDMNLLILNRFLFCKLCLPNKVLLIFYVLAPWNHPSDEKSCPRDPITWIAAEELQVVGCRLLGLHPKNQTAKQHYQIYNEELTAAHLAYNIFINIFNIIVILFIFYRPFIFMCYILK